MLGQDQPWRPRGVRVCHASSSLDQKEEEGQVPDLVKRQAPSLRWNNTRPQSFTNIPGYEVQKRVGRAPQYHVSLLALGSSIDLAVALLGA
jgi:hypothetical protein